MNKLDEADLAFSLFTTSSSQSFTSTSTISSFSTLIRRKFKQTKTSRAMAIKPYVFLSFIFTKIAFSAKVRGSSPPNSRTGMSVVRLLLGIAVHVVSITGVGSREDHVQGSGKGVNVRLFGEMRK